MIYFIAFILTTLLTHIARATPACGDVACPEKLYNPAIADAQHDQHTLFPIVQDNVRWTHKYDPDHSTKGIACSYFPSQYPQFKDFPFYPNIGGMWFIKSHPELCGTCWNLTVVKTHKTVSISVMAIDSYETEGADLTEMAFNLLNGGPGISLKAIFEKVDPRYCLFKK